MIQILSNRDQRHLQILTSLYNNHSQTLSQLAEISNSSKRNVHIDIQSLNEFIYPLFIATNPKEGCVLLCPDNISIDYIYSLILNNSFEFTLIESIFFEKYARLDDCADALFISTSTLKRIIKKINIIFSKLNFSITTTPLQLKGNENAICNMMINLFSEKYRFDHLPFSKLQTHIFDQLFSYVTKKQANYKNFSDRQQIKLYFFVIITRIKNHHTTALETSIPDNYDFNFLDNYLLKTMFQNVFKVPLTKETVTQLVQFIAKSNFAFDYQHLLSIIQDNPTENETVKQLHAFLNAIVSEFNLPLNNREVLLLELFNIKQLTGGKSYLLHDTRTEFVQNLIQHSNQISNIVYSGIEKATRLTKVLPNLDPAQLVYIFITHWEGFSHFLQSMKPICVVGVFFNSDTEHAQFIAHSLTDSFQGSIQFNVLEAVNLKEAAAEAKKYSFIITNISMLPIGNITCISINMFPNTNDIKKITDAYNSISYAVNSN